MFSLTLGIQHITNPTPPRKLEKTEWAQAGMGEGKRKGKGEGEGSRATLPQQCKAGVRCKPGNIEYERIPRQFTRILEFSSVFPSLLVCVYVFFFLCLRTCLVEGRGVVRGRSQHCGLYAGSKAVPKLLLFLGIPGPRFLTLPASWKHWMGQESWLPWESPALSWPVSSSGCCRCLVAQPCLCATPWTAAHQAVLHHLQEFAQTHVHRVNDAIRPFQSLWILLLLPSIFPSIRVFSSESALHVRWPNYWSFSFWVSPSSEYSGLISFRMDWFDVLAIQSEVTQLSPTLCSPVDCSPPHSSVHGIFQARILEWAAISFSRGSSWPRDQTLVSHTVGRLFTVWAARTLKLWLTWTDHSSTPLGCHAGYQEEAKSIWVIAG